MTIKKGQIVELRIEQSAFGGKGLAKVDGLAVFVELAVPGDRVLARIVRKKKNFAEARVVELLEPSADRVAAPCLYSGNCGGCKWQFLAYEKQLVYKRQQVRECIEHIGLMDDVPVHATLPSEKLFGYRNKMEFSCSTRRWLLPEELGTADVEAGMALGLHVPGTFDKVLDIDHCRLQPELGNRILGDVRRFIQASHLPVYGLRTHEGFWRFLVLRHSVLHDEWMVNIITARDERAHVQALADALVAAYPAVVSVVNNVTGRKASIAVGEYEINLAGRTFLIDRIGRYEFEISANSFFQTNTRQAERLYEQVVRYAGLTGAETVVDLYCGAGTIAIYVSDRAREVIGLEIVESAVADAERNCGRNGVSNCRFVGGDLRRTLPQLGVRPEVMIIDPPRAGMHADVVREVLVLGPERIVYVSCNPATLARDLGLLKEVYAVEEVQPVDMFPHTFHIEAVAKLVRRG
jgi:23S rRNA (uracil1939-C5)-methyltransferase